MNKGKSRECRYVADGLPIYSADKIADIADMLSKV
jgi:hypothetical protein